MIEIRPGNPSSDNTVVFVFNGGSNGCRQPSKTIEGSNFIFKMVLVDSPLPCLSAPLPYEIHWSVGRLRAGDYQVTQTDQVVGTIVQDFSVSQGQNPFPIPSLGIVGTLILAVGLVWIANKAFKRTPNGAA